MAGFEAVYVAGLLSLLYFLVLPAAAWLVALVVGRRAWRSIGSVPLSEPPAVHGGFVWRSYALITVETLLFGFVLWISWLPTVESLRSGGPPSSIDPAFGVFTYAGLVFAETVWITSLSQAWVFQQRTRDLLGLAFPRVLALLVIPAFGAALGLLAGYRAELFAAEVLSTITIQSGPASASASTGFLAFGLALLAIPAGTSLALRQDLTSHEGFVRAMTAALLGVLPCAAALVFLWFWALPV